ncbi:tRNA lysidine(34) synthetase TilS [Marinomonas profundimaris]|uniref:tRNA(Ile)-lysidine synthase n=1 Tax=Marinomonas profundimaris TaxID=1208321 RepID=W1RPB5_9GAMM|nr:tRNA lysidine(34) synthetase TilS [Marinomonas profundimaris]ETI58402.1 tRNA(Ile)-lysidine synthetase [Marinomonas profundimaris]
MTYSTLKSMDSLSPLRFNPEWIDCLFTQAKIVWLGFSGGVDSHVLLHALMNQLSHEQKQKLAAIHIHHGLSENADDWLVHCQSVCENLEVRFVAERVQLETQASIEDAARNARYQAFQHIMGDQDVILLAHHAADQVETVLFRLLRGTGGKGLAGMPKERLLGDGQARIIRPLLEVSKETIEGYAQRKQLKWIQDESNNDERFTRNFLRQRVMPVLKERFPKMEQSIASSAQRIATDYNMLATFANQQLTHWCNESGGFELSFIENKARDERLFWLRHFLQREHVSLSHAQLESVNSMFAGGEDRHPEFVFSNGRILRHQNAIYLLPLDKTPMLAPLVSGVMLKRAFDDVTVFGCDDCFLGQRPQGIALRSVHGKTRKLKKWLNDHQIPSWWREHLPYLYQGDTLVAIGDLWQHPDWHGKVEWCRGDELPFFILTGNT